MVRRHSRRVNLKCAIPDALRSRVDVLPVELFRYIRGACGYNGEPDTEPTNPALPTCTFFVRRYVCAWSS